MTARRKVGGRGRDRRAERTLQERYNDVRDFWARLAPEERRKLVRVPVSSLLESESFLFCSIREGGSIGEGMPQAGAGARQQPAGE